MLNSVKIVEFPGVITSKKNEDTYCDFRIEEGALVFTDKTVHVINYTSIEIVNYNKCKNLYPKMHPDNFMVFIELWIWEEYKKHAKLTNFYFEGTKDACHLKYDLFYKYQKKDSVEQLINNALVSTENEVGGRS